MHNPDPQSIIIRPTGPADAGALAALHARAMAGSGQAPWPEASFSDLLALPVTTGLALVRGGALQSDFLAFVMAQGAGGEAEITTIVTAPETRRQGMAETLLTALMDRLRQGGTTALFLEVRHDNRAALHLYEKLGFESVGRRERYYRDILTGASHDAVVMRRSLASTAGNREQ